MERKDNLPPLPLSVNRISASHEPREHPVRSPVRGPNPASDYPSPIWPPSDYAPSNQISGEHRQPEIQPDHFGADVQRPRHSVIRMHGEATRRGAKRRHQPYKTTRPLRHTRVSISERYPSSDSSAGLQSEPVSEDSFAFEAAISPVVAAVQQSSSRSQHFTGDTPSFSATLTSSPLTSPSLRCHHHAQPEAFGMPPEPFRQTNQSETSVSSEGPRLFFKGEEPVDKRLTVTVTDYKCKGYNSDIAEQWEEWPATEPKLGRRTVPEKSLMHEKEDLALEEVEMEFAKGEIAEMDEKEAMDVQCAMVVAETAEYAEKQAQEQAADQLPEMLAGMSTTHHEDEEKEESQVECEEFLDVSTADNSGEVDGSDYESSLPGGIPLTVSRQQLRTSGTAGGREHTVISRRESDTVQLGAPSQVSSGFGEYGDTSPESTLRSALPVLDTSDGWTPAEEGERDTSIIEPQTPLTVDVCDEEFENNAVEADNLTVETVVEVRAETEGDRLAKLPLAHNSWILGLLGNGEFGCVYKANVPGHEDCALKVFKKDKYRRDEFLLPLNHPHKLIVKMLGEYRTENGFICLAMAYAEGQTLMEIRESRPVTEKEALEVVRQILVALSHLHGYNILYGDFKLENVIQRPNGDICLIDFGFAKLLDGRGRCSEGCFGTPGYMAPEIIFTALKRANGFGLKSDIYSVVALAYIFMANTHAWDDGSYSDTNTTFMRTAAQPGMLAFKIREVFSERPAAILFKMAEVVPFNRPSAWEALESLSAIGTLERATRNDRVVVEEDSPRQANVYSSRLTGNYFTNTRNCATHDERMRREPHFPGRSEHAGGQSSGPSPTPGLLLSGSTQHHFQQETLAEPSRDHSDANDSENVVIAEVAQAQEVADDDNSSQLPDFTALFD